MGPLLLVLALPLVVYWLWTSVALHDGAPALLPRIPAPSVEALLLYMVWWIVQVGLARALPGREVEGTALADGTRLRYRLNGWRGFWVSLALALLASAVGLIAPGFAHEHFGELLSAANVFTFAFAAWVWWRFGRRDFFSGAALNPRVGGFDLKFFCETRPGLILWALIVLSLAAAQWQRHGAISPEMALVVAFQLLYVGDCLFHEEALLSTWDIRHERFGWMLAWGSLVWVPFTFSLQALYLVDHSPALPWSALAGITALDVAGYVVFRGANLQKHRFRLDPTRPVWGQPARYIRTARGPLLLVSGWWGLARHLNYLGDITMALAWCLLTGFRTPLTYFYLVYMVVLLVHRERRDHALCATRYGEDWTTYCRAVRWRILPGLY
jgi:ergosterol biosynthesis ERG4/ERG24 family protein